MPDCPVTPVDPNFRVGVERGSDGSSIVTVAGDVDLYSAPELRDRLGAIIDDDGRRMIIDLSEVTFLDSMALGVLLGAKNQLATVDGTLDLVVTAPELQRIFEITMLDQVFDLYPSRSEAIRSEGGGTAYSAASTDG